MASTLSPELMSMICAYLDHRDIKTGRLVSRQWDAAAKQKLFSRVNLKFNALSFDRLRLILGRVSLAFHVKTLHYDVRRLPRGIDRLDDWLDFAGNGWTISGRHNEKAYWQQLKQQEGHGNDLVYFERTRQLFKEQQGLCAGSVRICREYMLLRDVIMKCSQLRTLSFESGVENDWKIIHWQPGDHHDPRSQLSHIGQQTLIEPHCTADAYYKSIYRDDWEPDDFHPKRFRVFLEAARLTGRRIPRLAATTPDAWGFQVEFSPARRQDILLGGLVELRSIEICIEDCDLQDRQRHPLLLQSLARCCNLEEIKLGGRGIDSPAFEHTLNYIDFIDITPYLRGSKQASGIRKAHFHGCGLEERAFKSWLSCHSTTLRYFTLEDVSLHISDEQGDLIPVVEPMTYPDIPHLDHGPVVPQHQTSSWVRTFSFMSRTLRGLTFLELGGILSNCWSETYHVRKGLCKLGTMKRRVIEYILKDTASSFREATGRFRYWKDPETSLLLAWPWLYAYDPSWHFNSYDRQALGICYPDHYREAMRNARYIEGGRWASGDGRQHYPPCSVAGNTGEGRYVRPFHCHRIRAP